MLVDELLSISAARCPDKTAVVCGADRWSYRRVDLASTRVARAIVAAGTQLGDRVAICLDNSIEAIVSLFAALKAGCTFVIVHPQTRPGQLSGLMTDCGASVLVARAPQLQSIEFSQMRPPRLHTLVDAGPGLATFIETDRPDGATLPVRRFERDVAALVYTSGSTGAPKGVMLTHRNMTAAAEAICTYLGNTDGDVILNTLPLAFTYGLGQVTTAFRVGATVVLERSFSYPRAIVDIMEREQVTGLPLVPTMATLLLRQNLGRHRVPSLRYITNAAAALPAPKMRSLRDTFPAAAVYSMYGLTECQRVSYLSPDQLDARPDSVGIPIPGTSARVVDERGDDVSAGTIGELVVRGPHVMAGYWNRPEATRQVLRPSPVTGEMELHTGDLFRTDEAGWLYFVERTDDIIKIGGEKVAPKEIEHVIAELPEVADVAVFGMPDDVLGEVVTAVITPTGGMVIDDDHVRGHCLQRLEAHKVPRIINVCRELPTTLTGKISRRTLKATAMAERWSA